MHLASCRAGHKQLVQLGTPYLLLTGVKPTCEERIRSFFAVSIIEFENWLAVFDVNATIGLGVQTQLGKTVLPSKCRDAWDKWNQRYPCFSCAGAAAVTSVAAAAIRTRMISIFNQRIVVSMCKRRHLW